MNNTITFYVSIYINIYVQGDFGKVKSQELDQYKALLFLYNYDVIKMEKPKKNKWKPILSYICLKAIDVDIIQLKFTLKTKL